MKLHYLFPLFLLSLVVFAVPKTFPNVEQSAVGERFWIPSAPEPDVSLYDVWKSNGTINETSPGYYGNIQIFYEQEIWYVQHGGVHNWALTHVSFNSNIYIDSIRNALFDPIENRVIVYPTETIVTLSNGTVLWLDNRVCPLCNQTMHAAEFSPNSMAIYWFCDEDRLIIGEDLSR